MKGNIAFLVLATILFSSVGTAALFGYDNPKLPRIEPDEVTNFTGGGGGGGGGNVTSVDSTTNCIIVNPKTGDVLLTFNASCGGGNVFGNITDLYIPYENPIHNANFSQRNFTNFSYIAWGQANNAQVHYDGNNFIVDPKVVGTGYIDTNGGDFKVDNTGIVGSTPTSSEGITGSVSGATVTSMYYGKINAIPSVAGTVFNTFEGEAYVNGTPSGAGAVQVVRAYSGIAKIAINGTRSSSTRSATGYVASTGVLANQTTGSATLIGFSASNAGLGSFTHQGGSIVSIGFFAGGRPALFAGTLGSVNFWAAMFADDVQINSGSNLLLEGGSATKGDSGFMFDQGNSAERNSIDIFVDNSTAIQVENQTRIYMNRTDIQLNNDSRVIFEGNVNHTGTSYITHNISNLAMRIFTRNVLNYEANVTRTYVRGPIQTDSNQNLCLEGSSTVLGDSCLQYSNVPALTSQIVITLDGSRRIDINGTRTFMNGSITMNNDSRIILEDGYAGAGAQSDTYFTMNSTVKNLQAWFDGRLAWASNLTRTMINGSVGINIDNPNSTLFVLGNSYIQGSENNTGNLNMIAGGTVNSNGGGNITNVQFVNTRKLTVVNTTSTRIFINQTGAGGGSDGMILGGDMAGAFQIRTNGIPIANEEIAVITYGIPCNTNSSSVTLWQLNSTSTVLTGGNEVQTNGNRTAFTVRSGNTALVSLSDYRWYYHSICYDKTGDFPSAIVP